MAGWNDVDRIALGMPEARQEPTRGQRAWRVKKKLFVWERPLRQREVEELGAAAPDGPVLGAKVDDLFAKEAMVADEPELYFTTPHFDGYPSVLVRLDRISIPDLEELIVGAWLAVAPERLAQAYQGQPVG